MHANYGFDQFEVDFSPDQEDEDDEFEVTKLKPSIRNYLKELPADYDAYEPMPQVSFEKDVDQLTTRLHEVHLAEQIEHEAESLM